MSFKKFLREQKHVYRDEPTPEQQARLDKPLRYFSSRLPESLKNRPYPDDETTAKEIDDLIELRKEDPKASVALFKKYDNNFSQHFYNYVKENGLNLSKDNENKLREIVSEAANLVLELKFHYNRPRPFQEAKRLGKAQFKREGSETAKTPSYPSGHTAQSRMLAKILSTLFPEHRTAFLNISIDCSLSREHGGVHFKSDNDFGTQVGDALYDLIRPDLPSLFSFLQEKVYPKSGLGKWFNQQSAGGGPGWDRYGLEGQKLGKCGDGKEGDAYAACLSKQKADKLGKDGIAAFVRRKREAQKKAGDKAKGGESKKGEAPTNVRTEGKPADMGAYVAKMKAKLEDSGLNLSRAHPRDTFEDLIGSTATARLAHRGVIEIEGGLDEENVPKDQGLWDRVLDAARSKFDVFPSAYASAWASREYKKRGGEWVTKS